MMTIHEFGKENSRVIVLIHPSVVMWDYFEYVVPHLEGTYRLVIPALPGYDEEQPGDYTSVVGTGGLADSKRGRRCCLHLWLLNGRIGRDKDAGR